MQCSRSAEILFTDIRTDRHTHTHRQTHCSENIKPSTISWRRKNFGNSNYILIAKLIFDISNRRSENKLEIADFHDGASNKTNLKHVIIDVLIPVTSDTWTFRA